MRSIVISLALGALALPAAAAAATTLHLATVDPTNDREGFGVTYVGLHTPLTFDITLPGPLAANAYTDVFANALSYTASAGTPETTVTNLNYVGGNRYSDVHTDASGHIDGWNIHVVGANNSINGPTTFLEYHFSGYNGVLNGADILFYRADAQFNYGSVSCSNATCGTPSGFGVAPGAGGVPEPASWTMMLMGFALAGAVLRRRGFQVAPLPLG